MAASVTLACGSPRQPATQKVAPTHAIGTLAEYLPLTHDTVYAYDVENDSGETGVLTLQVEERSPGLVELRAGGKSQLLEVSERQISHVLGGILLKLPLSKGDSYPGEFGEVKVISMQRSLQVPAGAFEHCIETREEAVQGEMSQRSVKIFCPKAGLAFFENSAQKGAELSVQTARLRYSGPRIDVFAE
jgi:hypothetical protein